MEQEKGTFTLVTGPMFSGKSKFLVDNYSGKPNVEAFLPVADERDECIKSRASKKTIQCRKITRPSEILQSRANTIIVDEYQFIDNIEELKRVIETLKKQHRRIILAGLDLLANKEEWKNYTELKDVADEHIKLKATCEVCKQDNAIYSKLVAGTMGIETGTTKYEPRCQDCFDL